jgi:hypothetical protein
VTFLLLAVGKFIDSLKESAQEKRAKLESGSKGIAEEAKMAPIMQREKAAGKQLLAPPCCVTALMSTSNSAKDVAANKQR